MPTNIYNPDTYTQKSSETNINYNLFLHGNYVKRSDIDSVMIIGAGPIVIGQACEFDYSGVQACRALMQEGYRVILVNLNPATIMMTLSTLMRFI